MIQQDYILRLVEQMTRVLAQVLFFKGAKQVDDAKDLLDEVGKLLGLADRHALIHQPPSALLALSTHGGRLHGDFLNTLADLLVEAGLLAPQDSTEQHRAFTNALHLYLMFPADPEAPLPMDLNQKIDFTLARLGDQGLPATVYPLLHAHFERRGAFAKAEDYLYHWAALAPVQARQAGAGYYERLLALPDTLLTAGRLPRAEVLEGQATWNQHYPIDESI